MIFSTIHLWIVICWAVFATAFYLIRYRKVKALKNPWIIVGIFAVNFFFFAWSALIFILLEFIRSKNKSS